MVRVAHQKATKQAGPSTSVRGSKIAKQRKNHKVVIESDTKDNDKARAVLSFRADPPPGYTFIPAGNPQLTSALKEFAKKNNHQIFAVTTTPHASRHELSREVHRIGFHFPTEVVAQVCNHYGIRLTSGGKLVEEKDDDMLFMRLYQKGQTKLDETVRDQVTINTEAKQIIQDLFPNIPDNDLFQIIKTAFQLGDGKVGTAEEIPLVRRAQLSVVAHIRHCYTNYDKLLRKVPYSEARHKVENITLQKLIDWRGDGHDDKQAMDDTLREVVVISDEEDSDDIEEGQLLENEHLRVQPVNGAVQSKINLDARNQSPIEIHSEEDAPRGYRYLPRVVRRYPVQDAQALSVARQQSRYAVWDRVRQEYRSGLPSQAPRVVERILLDEPPVVAPRTSYVTMEPLYISEQAPRRFVEQPVRVVSQPNPPTYVRGADGKLYEKVTSYSEQVGPSVPPRRIYTPPPPAEHNRQYIDSYQASSHQQPPRLHRRTESFENNDGTVLPSIEGANGIQSPPTARRNPFDDSRAMMYRANAGAYEANHRQVPVIDLTHSAEQASKRRRIEGAPPSPYLGQQNQYSQSSFNRNTTRAEPLYQYVDDRNTLRPQQVIQLENPVTTFSSHMNYERVEPRQVVVRQEEKLNNQTSLQQEPPRRYLPAHNGNVPHYADSPRRVEYLREYDQRPARPITETTVQIIPADLNVRSQYASFDDVPFRGQAPINRASQPERRNHPSDPGYRNMR